MTKRTIQVEIDCDDRHCSKWCPPDDYCCCPVVFDRPKLVYDHSANSYLRCQQCLDAEIKQPITPEGFEGKFLSQGELDRLTDALSNKTEPTELDQFQVAMDQLNNNTDQDKNGQ